MSHFDDVSLLPDDPIFRLPHLFAHDNRTEKVNLGIGVYQNEKGETPVFSSVKKAENLLIQQKQSKNYLPIDGDPHFISASLKLILGKKVLDSIKERLCSFQTVGGASALRLGAEFLKAQNKQKIFISDPSWINHSNIFKRAGLIVSSYPYLCRQTQSLRFTDLIEFVLKLSPGDTLLLQTCGHNPTGLDPTPNQWQELASVIKSRQIIPFFDFAYQGFADHIDADAAPIRYFAENGLEMLIAYSYSKNMGLYGERAGTFTVIAHSPETAQHIASHVRQTIRSIYSTPPMHGGQIASIVLQNPDLKKEWLTELYSMQKRLSHTRRDLAKLLNMETILNQKGMFAWCGLSEQQVNLLIQEFSIYLPQDGRINLAGLNPQNINYVSDSILKVRQNLKAPRIANT